MLLLLTSRYRKFTLSDGHGLVVRCTHDSALPPTHKGQSANQYISIKSLNEWDPKVQLPTGLNSISCVILHACVLLNIFLINYTFVNVHVLT